MVRRQKQGERWVSGRSLTGRSAGEFLQTKSEHASRTPQGRGVGTGITTKEASERKGNNLERDQTEIGPYSPFCSTRSSSNRTKS